MADNEKVTEKVSQEAVTAEVKQTDIIEVPKKDVSKKKKKSQKPNVFSRIGKWFKELVVEAKKVVWPTQKTVWKNTLVVIILVIIVSAFVAIVDFVFGGIRDLLATLLNSLF